MVRLKEDCRACATATATHHSEPVNLKQALGRLPFHESTHQPALDIGERTLLSGDVERDCAVGHGHA